MCLQGWRPNGSILTMTSVYNTSTLQMTTDLFWDNFGYESGYVLINTRFLKSFLNSVVMLNNLCYA